MRIAIMAAFTLTLVALAGAGPVRRAGAQEVYWPTHGWRRSSPEEQGMDSQVLAEAFDYIHERYRFRLTFASTGVTVEFAEKSGALANARFRGRSR